MVTMMTDEAARTRMGEVALCRARELQWSRTAEAALATLEEAAA